MGAEADAPRWYGLAARTAAAVRERMWDPQMGMFFDVDPRTGARTNVKASVCFYPYFTDLATADHLPGLERHLLDPHEFWTPFPLPSSSVDDPLFNPFAEWKGKRHVCPWNGRVWPMTNSHVAESLGRASRSYAPHLRTTTAQFISRYVRMMFHDGNLARANCYEHYNPFTGHAAVYRGIDDYQHSWVADLIIKYVMGIRPHDGGVTVDPFPFGVELAELTGVRVRGALIDVRVQGERVFVRANGGPEREGKLGQSMELSL